MIISSHIHFPVEEITASFFMAGVISLCIYIIFSSLIPLSLAPWDHSSALGNSALRSALQLSLSGIDFTAQL